MRDLARTMASTKITAHQEMFNPEVHPFGEITILAVDSMTTRRAIWDNLKADAAVRLMVEARMGVSEIRVMCMCPADPAKRYEATLYTAEESVAGACQTQTTVVATACATASFIVWSVIEFLGGNPPVNEMILALAGRRPMITTSFRPEPAGETL